MTDFVGVDGEGVTRDNGNHDYVLLSVGGLSLTNNGLRLTYREIFPFLYRHFVLNPTSVYVGYYLSYDFAQWVKDFPEPIAHALFSPEGIAARQRTGPNPLPIPVRHDGWEMDFLGLRRFRLRRANGGSKWMFINDCGPFWQTSFMNAINPKNWGETPVVSQEDYERIRVGKADRSSAVLDAAMVDYNITENSALATTMSRLDSGFRSQRWNLRRDQWFGPGQVADKWLKSIGAPLGKDVREVTPSEVMNAAQAAYYGGWFEIPRHGHLPGITYEYDINSAYPAVIAELPCLLHGDWNRRNTVDPDAQWQLCYVQTRGTDAYLGGLPHRDDKGIISRPLNTEGWYWWHEVEAAKNAGLIDVVQVRDVWTYIPCLCTPPFNAIVSLYQQRLTIGKNTAQGKALKLVYNSSYGKFAQSVGRPKYANSIYASLITAGCRMQILTAIASHPQRSRAVRMVATDGIYFSSPHPSLELSPDKLRAWDVAQKSNLTLFMPGVYWDDQTRETLGSKDGPKLKSRGISAADLAARIRDIDSQFNTYIPGDLWPTISLPVRFSVTSPRLALARGKWHTCGSIVSLDHPTTWAGSTPPKRVIDANPSNKRIPESYLDDGIVTTRPYVDKGVSVSYSKQFGAEMQDMTEGDEFSDDGSIGREVYELLTMGD